MLYKKMLAALSAAVLGCTVTVPSAAPAAAAEEYAAEVDLFYLNPSYESYLTIPDSCAQSYQIKLPGTYESVSYRAGDEHIGVDENGLVAPKGEEIYYIGSGTEYEFAEGDFTVTVTADSTRLVYMFHVHDYAIWYAHSVADSYLEENITAGMTEREKLDAICKFVAGYDYSAYHSGMVSMIATGEGGDCWASTGTVNYMCGKLGMQARTRNAANDPGAGSGHRNSVVEGENGIIYMVDAGYSGSAPRYYSIKEYPHPYAYKERANGTLELTEYFGFDTEIEVPSEMDGKTVTAIGSSLFYSANRFIGEEITSVTIPETIVSIGDSAFYDMDGLTELYIPKSVGYIAKAAFCECDQMKLVIDPQNPYYVMKDHVLYTKDMKTLVSAAELYTMKNVTKTEYSKSYTWNKMNFTVPDGVEYIEDQAFYDCGALGGLVLPDSLKHIGYAAFRSCNIGNTVVLPESLTGVGYGAFSYSGAPALVLLNPDTVINDTTENSLNEQEEGSTLNGSTPMILISAEGSTAQAYVEKFGKGTSTYYSDSGTYTEEYDRYLFGLLGADGTAELGSGTAGDCGYRVFWSEETGLVMQLTGSGTADVPADETKLTGKVEGIILDKGVTRLSDALMKALTKTTTIFGVKGTYAEQLAFKEGYNFTEYPKEQLAGDVDANGTVNIADAVMLARFLAEDQAITVTAEGKRNAELDGVSGLTSGDSTVLLQMLAGLT